MMMNQSIKLARWWAGIVDLHDTIESSILPVGVHLHIEDHRLMDTLEALARKIRSHVEAYQLHASIIDGQK